jgi:Cu/Ag efflux pump CusA
MAEFGPVGVRRLGASDVEGFPPIGDGIINDGRPAAHCRETAKHAAVTRDVETALSPSGLAGLSHPIFRPATFIEMSLSNLNRALLLGCLLVIIVLALFLMEWRSAFISITAIPLSLLAAAVVLHYRGGTLNTMVLAGLAIALGEVVDDAIIDVENIVRRLRLNRAAAEPRPVFDVVLDASLEVRSAVVYATLIVALVFIPVFFLEGLAGSFFRPPRFLAVAASPGRAHITPATRCSPQAGMSGGLASRGSKGYRRLKA